MSNELEAIFALRANFHNACDAAGFDCITAFAIPKGCEIQMKGNLFRLAGLATYIQSDLNAKIQNALQQKS